MTALPAATIFADFEVDGTTVKKPVKSQIREWALAVEVGPLAGIFGDASGWDRLYGYGWYLTPLQGISDAGGVATYGASRTSDADDITSACIGVLGFAYNDNTSYNKFVWGGYFEARRFSGAGGAHGVEVESTNLGSVVAVGPYSPYVADTTVGLWVAAGGNTISSPAYDPVTGLSNLTAVASSAAIGIVYNQATYTLGIMFGENALTGADGTTGGGYAPAIVAAQHHDFEWWMDDAGIGTVAARIRSTMSSTTAAGQLVFTDSGVEVQHLSGTPPWLRSSGTASSVNGIEIVSSATGTAPYIKPIGTDANIGLVFLPKGSPATPFYFGGYTAIVGGLQVGAAGASSGILRLDGVTSGYVAVTAPDTITTYSFILPQTVGTAGQVLTSQAGSTMTWTTLGTAADEATGTSGATLGFLNGNNTYSGTSSFTGAVDFSSSTAYSPQPTIYNTTSDATAGYLILQKSRSGGAVSVDDSLGTVVFKGADTGSTQRNSMYMTAVATAVDASSVTGRLDLGSNALGTPIIQMYGADGSAKFNYMIETVEQASAPSAPAANGVRIYAVDNGAGKTQLMALFSSGAAQQLAIQP